MTRLDASAQLRASAAWKLVPLDRLSPAERAHLGADLAPDTYGVLIPRTGVSVPKAVAPETALLFLTLSEPMGVPTYVRASFGVEADDAIAQLVADGILEAQVNGVWVSGAAAFRPSAAQAASQSTAPTPSATAVRSLLALRAAAALPAADASTIESFLYRYGTTPIVPARAREWADADAIRGHLGLDALANGPALSDERAWWVFGGDSGLGEGACPKLYVGVAVSALPEAVRRLSELIGRHAEPAPPFKIGASARGLHRPDRIVFYPASAQQAAAWGVALATVLCDLPADPVPFTASLDPRGCVSWGNDPPRTDRDWWDDEGSWRGIVTRTLAVALASARSSSVPEPWRYALERVRLAGVDPETWEPIDGRGNPPA